MRSVSGKEFAKILERHGWSLLRVQGSHHNLWQSRERCPAVCARPRQPGAQDGTAPSLDEDGGAER